MVLVTRREVGINPCLNTNGTNASLFHLSFLDLHEASASEDVNKLPLRTIIFFQFDSVVVLSLQRTFPLCSFVAYVTLRLIVCWEE